MVKNPFMLRKEIDKKFQITKNALQWIFEYIEWKEKPKRKRRPIGPARAARRQRKL